MQKCLYLEKIIYRRNIIKKFDKINSSKILQNYCDKKYFDQEFMENGSLKLVHDIIMELNISKKIINLKTPE